MGVVTNNWIDDIHNTETKSINEFSNHVDVLIESCKVGLRKPDVNIYQLACHQLGVSPSQVQSS